MNLIAMMKTKYLAIAVLSLGILGVKECQESVPLDSLCIIEAGATGYMCWRNKENNDGFAVREMDDWYCLNPSDLDRVVDRLLYCKELEENN